MLFIHSAPWCCEFLVSVCFCEIGLWLRLCLLTCGLSNLAWGWQVAITYPCSNHAPPPACRRSSHHHCLEARCQPGEHDAKLHFSQERLHTIAHASQERCRVVPTIFRSRTGTGTVSKCSASWSFPPLQPLEPSEFRSIHYKTPRPLATRKQTST